MENQKRLVDFFKIFKVKENIELEARITKKLTRINFENAIQKLKSLGFVAHIASGSYHLNINNQFMDPRAGRMRQSNIRTTIAHLVHIQEYCRENKIPLDNTPHYIKFAEKMRVQVRGEPLLPIDYNDFKFRVNLKQERELLSDDTRVEKTLKDWNNNKKTFRFIKRFTFKHSDFPLKVDFSIVKSSRKTKKGRLIPEYTIEKSNIFRLNENYEIEIEMDNERKNEMEVADLIKKFKTVIKYILSGIQQTNYPISYNEQNQILKDYIKVLYPKKKEGQIKYINSRDFVGPQPISLEYTNIFEKTAELNFPNIRGSYTVTEKADGIRKLLFIAPISGKIYLIDVNMNVQFTGSICKQKEYHKTIMDGEHILHGKKGKFLNLFLLFDIYYVNGDDVRSNPFIRGKAKAGRYNTLNSILTKIVLENVTPNNNFQVRIKTFYHSESGTDIFKNCKTILANQHNETFEYETDGLIFNPAKLAVGASPDDNVPKKPTKRTWIWALKWKPPQYNTIDFLVTTKKMSNGSDFIGNIFENGENLSHAEQLTQYKSLILRVGFDESRHGFLNPFEDIINENFSKKTGHETNSYKPHPFMPTEPTDKTAWKCNILLENGERGAKYLFIEDKTDTFEDNTIVEFRYDLDRKKDWRWIPIRVRYDKTAAFRRGERNYGNAYHVAQSIWKSIHNPITEEMITTGENIPEELGDDDVYYNKASRTSTRGLRDFHNLFVKRRLILTFAHHGGTLIDLACGKAGDLPKWIHSKLSFVFGLDISRDNIENRKDGACARYLKKRRVYNKSSAIPSCLFVNADSKLNIRKGEASVTERGKQITLAIFGEGAKNQEKLGSGVYKQYGIGKEGFDVVSVQFALHYFFTDITTLNSFLTNVSETCKIGGYFIGTCYDGKKVFNLLEDKKQNESAIIIQDEKKMWEVKKRYDSDTFNDDETSLGYAIDVYQESINKTFTEYLVNFTYLKRLLENYGFRTLKKNELKNLNFPNSIGSFQDLFYSMQEKLEREPNKKIDYKNATSMSENEKKISFLNNYFIFKKVHNVNAGQVSLVISEDSKEEIDDATNEGEELSNIEDEKETKQKLKTKITLTTNNAAQNNNAQQNNAAQNNAAQNNAAQNNAAQNNTPPSK